MSSPQFDRKRSINRWYSLTYQSNNLLNKEEHYQIKPMIAKILVKEFNAIDIHSYIHGTIIFSINTTDAVGDLDKFIKRLKVPFDSNKPKLLFSIDLVTQGDSTKNYMYIDGDDVLESHFKKLISSFYPKR